MKGGIFRKWKIKERFLRVRFSLTKWSMSGEAGQSLCQPSSTTLCMCARFTLCITCKDLVRFASFKVHPAVVAYEILHITLDSPKGTKILLIASNLYVHTVLICACFTPSPGLY